MENLKKCCNTCHYYNHIVTLNDDEGECLNPKKVIMCWRYWRPNKEVVEEHPHVKAFNYYCDDHLEKIK